MAASAKNRALGNTDMAADDDLFQVQKPALLAKPYMITDRQFPREGNFHLRLEGNVMSNLCAKRS